MLLARGQLQPTRLPLAFPPPGTSQFSLWFPQPFCTFLTKMTIFMTQVLGTDVDAGKFQSSEPELMWLPDMHPGALPYWT